MTQLLQINQPNQQIDEEDIFFFSALEIVLNVRDGIESRMISDKVFDKST